MEPLGGLLRRRPGQEGENFIAAMVVETCNAVLREVLHLAETDARAASYQNGTMRVLVSHGAVAGTIQQRSGEITNETNKRLKKNGASRDAVTNIVTRLSL